MKSLNLVNTIAEYNLLKSNYDSIDPYVCYIQNEQLTMYDGIPSTWQIRYTSNDGNIVAPSTNQFGNVNIVSNIYRDGEGVIVFDGSVTSIEYGAFANCSSLASITIPNSVTSIGGEAFSNTPWLNNQPDGCIYINSILYVYKGEMPENTHIDVKEGTTMICSEAFSSCSSLTSITIPNSVTSIGDYAFLMCESLISVVMASIVPPSLYSYVFNYTHSNLIIYVPDESVDAYKTAANWSSYASKIKPISEKPV